MVTIIGVIALFVAVVTGSTPLAMIVVALAVTGIVLLVREWREESSSVPAAALAAPQSGDTRRRESPSPESLSPDEFSPDISTDPHGPSSDARAD